MRPPVRPRESARSATVETVVQPRWMNVPPSPQMTCAFGNDAACFKYPRSGRTVSRSSRCAFPVWPDQRSSLCRHHEAAVARNTRKTPVCIGMSFIRNGRPEPGPDPSEGPQRPSSVSHKTRRTLSLFSGIDPVLANFSGSSPHRAMPAFLSKQLIWNSRGIWGRKIGNGNRQNLAQVAKLSLLGR